MNWMKKFIKVLFKLSIFFYFILDISERLQDIII